MTRVLRFRRSPYGWWRKPLVQMAQQHLPAELAVLAAETKEDEAGAWLNSRGVSSGVVGLVMDDHGVFKSVRKPLPEFVRELLRQIYREAGVGKGIPDLVIWTVDSCSARFVEVKCPDWDRASADQVRVHEVCRSLGYKVEIREWRFVEPV